MMSARNDFRTAGFFLTLLCGENAGLPETFRQEQVIRAQ